MSALAAAVAQKASRRCRAKRLRKENCSISLQGAPTGRLIVDLDCKDLRRSTNQKYCDYLFIGKMGNTDWVGLIEMKGGRFKVSEVVKQLWGGTKLVGQWFPPGSSFEFVPVLAHGKGGHPKDLRELRRKKIKLRGKEKQIKLLRCRNKLVKALS